MNLFAARQGEQLTLLATNNLFNVHMTMSVLFSGKLYKNTNLSVKLFIIRVKRAEDFISYFKVFRSFFGVLS